MMLTVLNTFVERQERADESADSAVHRWEISLAESRYSHKPTNGDFCDIV